VCVRDTGCELARPPRRARRQQCLALRAKKADDEEGEGGRGRDQGLGQARKGQAAQAPVVEREKGWERGSEEEREKGWLTTVATAATPVVIAPIIAPAAAAIIITVVTAAAAIIVATTPIVIAVAAATATATPEALLLPPAARNLVCPVLALAVVILHLQNARRVREKADFNRPATAAASGVRFLKCLAPHTRIRPRAKRAGKKGARLRDSLAREGGGAIQTDLVVNFVTLP